MVGLGDFVTRSKLFEPSREPGLVSEPLMNEAADISIRGAYGMDIVETHKADDTLGIVVRAFVTLSHNSIPHSGLVGPGIDDVQYF